MRMRYYSSTFLMSSPKDYTVVLSILAVQAFLDKEYGRSELAPDDNEITP
jgi:hypothetical protein